MEKITQDVLQEYFPDLRVDGNDLRCKCPLCQDDGSLTFSPTYYLAFCFTCNKGANWGEAIAIFYKNSESN